MATANLSSVSQQPLPIQNTCTNEDDLIQLTFNIIKAKTGNPPANADHVYDLMQHIDDFPHHCPTVTDNTGGTLPTPSPRPIAQTLQGWRDVSSQDLNSMHAIFHHVGENDQRLAYDHYSRELGRSPTVQEFSKFLLNFEGNDLTDSSRKTLGQLYLENKKSKKTINQNLQALHQLKQMLRLIDSRNRALQSEKRNLEGTICNIQYQKEDLQLEFNSLKRNHDQHLAELEDERKDKQQFQADKEVFNHRCAQLLADKLALQNTITHLSETVTDLENKNLSLENKTKQQSFSITTLETKLQQQNQRQQYFFIFLAAVFFAMVYFQFFS